MNQIVTPLPNPPVASDWSWPALMLIGLVTLVFVVLAFSSLRRRHRMTTPMDILKDSRTPAPPPNMPPPLYPPI